MALEIAIRRFGGPEVLEARDVPPEAPGKGRDPHPPQGDRRQFHRRARQARRLCAAARHADAAGARHGSRGRGRSGGRGRRALSRRRPASPTPRRRSAPIARCATFPRSAAWRCRRACRTETRGRAPAEGPHGADAAAARVPRAARRLGGVSLGGGRRRHARRPVAALDRRPCHRHGGLRKRRSPRRAPRDTKKCSCAGATTGPRACASSQAAA